EVVRLIVLDHENRIPDSLLRALREQRFDVTFTTVAEEARRYADDPRALILVDDYFGGVGSGIDLAEELMRESRGATIAIMTHDRSIEGRTRAANACHVILYKPLSLGLFLAAASTASEIGTEKPARVVEDLGD